MGGITFRRVYNGVEYRAANDDVFNTKKEALKKAKAYRSRGYNARIAHSNIGRGRYMVYHSMGYSRR